jgi:hypothetical protein
VDGLVMASGRPEGSFVCVASEWRCALRSARVWVRVALRASRAVRRGLVVGLGGSVSSGFGAEEGDNVGGSSVVGGLALIGSWGWDDMFGGGCFDVGIAVGQPKD